MYLSVIKSSIEDINLNYIKMNNKISKLNLDDELNKYTKKICRLELNILKINGIIKKIFLKKKN